MTVVAAVWSRPTATHERVVAHETPDSSTLSLVGLVAAAMVCGTDQLQVEPFKVATTATPGCPVLSPTATQVVAVLQKTLCSREMKGASTVATGRQDWPASAVVVAVPRIVDDMPTATQSVSVAQETPKPQFVPGPDAAAVAMGESLGGDEEAIAATLSDPRARVRAKAAAPARPNERGAGKGKRDMKNPSFEVGASVVATDGHSMFAGAGARGTVVGRPSAPVDSFSPGWGGP